MNSSLELNLLPLKVKIFEVQLKIISPQYCILFYEKRGLKMFWDIITDILLCVTTTVVNFLLQWFVTILLKVIIVVP